MLFVLLLTTCLINSNILSIEKTLLNTITVGGLVKYNKCLLYITKLWHINYILFDLKTQINSNLLIVGDFKTTLSPIDRSSGQNNNNDKTETPKLIDILHQMYLTNTSRVFHSSTKDDSLYSAAHGALLK